MARTKGSFSLAGTLEILADAPADARTVVATKADLTAAGSYQYKYVGMIVSVASEGKAYMLTASDPTVSANWTEIGSGGASFPSGGTTGQALVKHSNADDDVEWGSVVAASEKGAASGVAELDVNGKVPSSQLPSYVDDVIEGYLYDGKFYEEDTHTTEITPETGKIYVDISSEKTYRWSGSAYVEISESLALGETSSTAYAGNKGKQNADNITALQTLTRKLKADIASVEDGDTSVSAYSEGDLILFKGDLTKASTSISIGDTLAIGTNLTATTIEDEIAAHAGGGGSLETALNVSMTTGGIESGTSYAAGTSYDTLWHELLDPTQYPTLTAPSATLAATGAKLLETGATLATTMTITFNRGSINPAYGTSGYRSGAATGYSLAGGSTQSDNTFSVTVTSAKLSYQGNAEYAAGEQPKDSHGGNYSTPLVAGNVDTNTISYEFVDAMWSNVSSISTIAKMSLVSKSAKQRDMVFPAQTVTNPEVFDIPASWTVTAVQVKNDLSGAFEDASAQFTVTDTTHNDAAGNSVNYKRYTFSLGIATGARTVRVKWS